MTRRTAQLELGGDEAMGRVTASMASKILVLVPPWVVLVLVLILGGIGHSMWGEPPAVTWAAMAGTLCSVILGALTWSVSHSRGLLGRVHTTATAGGGALWFTVAMVTGPFAPVTMGLWFFGGFTLAVGWNIRTVIRAHQGPEDAQGGDPLARLFDQAKASFGLDGSKVRTRAVTDHKIKAELELPAGKKTTEDVAKKTAYMESGMGFPAGAVQVAANEDRSDRAHLTITDPKLMKKPLPWEGPSKPGRSIAEPLRIGLFQDAEPVLHTLVGHHLQVMGMSGSGKSIGAAWNYLAEIITRTDAVVMAADITKGDQTLGPFRPALHRFDTTAAGARALIADIEAQIKPRTDFLAAKGMQKWQEGCGLDYWVIWLEEVPDIIEALGDKGGDKLLRILKALRSAGGSVVMSLQRSDYSQMPTLARGQLAHMCLGVANAQDAGFGLSEAQQEAEARPELWGNKRPGMAYLDAPSIPETHIAMPLRSYAWGEGPEAAEAIAELVAQYPAAHKVSADPFTAKVARLPEAAPVLVGAATAPSGSGQAHVSVGGSEDALEGLAAAAERIVATQRVDLGHVPPVERARLLEALERKGIIGPAQPGGERQVLVSSADEAIAEILDDGDPVAEYLTVEDPSPEIVAGPDDEIADLTEEEAALQTPPKERRILTPAESRAVLHDWLRRRAAQGRRSSPWRTWPRCAPTPGTRAGHGPTRP
ncbi:type IV secretory system conjugative DNA transfer family protein [Nocardiopsis sp. ARC36]